MLALELVKVHWRELITWMLPSNFKAMMKMMESIYYSSVTFYFLYFNSKSNALFEYVDV